MPSDSEFDESQSEFDDQDSYTSSALSEEAVEDEQALPPLQIGSTTRPTPIASMEQIDQEALQEARGEIAGDFERLYDNIQASNREVPGPEGSQWAFSIGEDDDYNVEEDMIDGLDALGNKKSSKRGRRKGSRTNIELSHQVKALIGEAAAAFVDQDLSKTVAICQEVIRIEPMAHAAWNTLALVHEERSQFDDALKLKIMAAHLEGDSDVWRDLGRASRDIGQMQQALYCFRKAVSLNPRDVDAIWDRSVMLREIGESRAAMNGFLAILKVAPFHMGVLLQLAPLFSVLSEFRRGIGLFKESLAYYRMTMPDGPVSGEQSDCIVLLATLADFCTAVGEYEQAIHGIRDGARWIQGRTSQRHWATLSDDREYDVEGYIRSTGADDAAARPQGFYPLDPNLRHRLALARLALGDLDEGQMHGSVVLENDVREYSLLYTELAAAYFDKGLYGPALRVYEELAAHDEMSTIAILMQIAACHRHVSDFDKCVEVLRYVLEVDPDNIDAKMKLAEAYEIIDQPRMALSLVKEVIAWRKAHKEINDEASANDTTTEAPIDTLFEEKRRTTKSKAALPLELVQSMELARQNAVDEAFAKLAKLDPISQQAEWMKEAGGLIDVFRETRELFGNNRFVQFRGSIIDRRLRKLANAKDADKDMASRLQLDISLPKSDTTLSEFRRRGFDEWLGLFMQFSFYATRDGNYALADEILRHMLFSNAYVSFRHQTAIRIALLACATVQKDYDAILEHSRRLIFTHQFNNDPIRLFLACLGGGIHTIDAFINTSFQKSLRRELQHYQFATKGEQMTFAAARNRWAFANKTGDKDDEDDSDADDEPKQGQKGRRKPLPNATVGADPSPSKATKESPVLLALYGQLSSTAKSYQSALFYLYQAYDLQSDDPVICLCLAVASISRAMQRQADNRHHMIAQGLGFIQRYRSVRKEDYTEEVEYNFGRLFHQLGLLSLAVKHYERVLALAETRLPSANAQCKSLSREAAYNLVLIYSTTGGANLAKSIAKKWLSF